MAMSVYNTLKQRLETVEVELTEKNTTWFDDATRTEDIHTITDLDDGLLIAQLNYNYPIWGDGVSRADVNYSERGVKNLVGSWKSSNREK